MCAGTSALLLAPSFVSNARAQQRPDTPQSDLGPLAVTSFGQSIRLADWEQTPSLPLALPRPPKPGRSTIALNSLYVSTVAVQGLGLRDVFSVDFRVEADDSVHLIEFEVCPGLPCFDFRAYCQQEWGFSLAAAMAEAAAARIS